MIRLAGQPILTAAAMRAAEDAAIETGASVDTLMQRAGSAIAEQVRRLAAGADVLILCGPGNNGGDGYVAARLLAHHGAAVRVAATGDPKGEAARAARSAWAGPVATLDDAVSAPILVDALFGTGLARPLDVGVAAHLHRHVAAAALSIAVDLPSGVSTDTGALFGDVPTFDLTLALSAAKPAHVLQPAAARCGAVRILPIGVEVASDASVLSRPALCAPGPDAHKYSRGLVAVVAGAMPGAGRLAATAAMRAGAGYSLLLGGQGGPDALVHRDWSIVALDDKRIGAVVIGPGLGRDASGSARLDAALAIPHPLVIDGDALHLVQPDRLAQRKGPTILTPHAGEFAALFGDSAGSRIVRARDAAAATGAVVVFKGADTVIAAPDGRVRVATAGSSWLSTAGTGDVLAGTIGAMAAARQDPFAAASAGVWLHADAARRCGASFIADDLAHAMTAARAAL